MRKWFSDLDRILRGEATRSAAIRGKTLDVSAAGLSAVIVVLSVLYGACMGSSAVFRPGEPVYMQLLASAMKVPALFFLTLLVTFPSLYVFNALLGSRLSLLALARLLIASLGVNVAVLASLGPIVVFFAVSTTSYAFMVLLNVLIYAVSGGLGLAFLLQTLQRLTVSPLEPLFPPPLGEAAVSPAASTAAEQAVEAEIAEPSALEAAEGQILAHQVKAVFKCWVVVFGLVGAQMGWVLRPFIGSPGAPFTWLRERQSNFFEAVFHTFISLFS